MNLNLIFGSFGVFLLAQLIAWVWWAATVNVTLKFIKESMENDLSEIKISFTEHKTLDEQHHKAVWKKVDSHTLALAKAGLLSGSDET